MSENHAATVENDAPVARQICWDRHGSGPCPLRTCACLAGHRSPHHDEHGRPISPAETALSEGDAR